MKWTIGIIGILLLILTPVSTPEKSDFSDIGIKKCTSIDGSGENQTYPCKRDDDHYYGTKYVIYYRGSDAGCPIVNDSKCIDVDDWTN